MSSTEIKRPNYYEGQYLGATDLAAAQDYQRQQDQRHRLAAHTWGIAVGLELVERPQPGSSDAVDIYVNPGYAVDGFGRAIAVLEPYKCEESQFAHYVLDPTNPDGQWVPMWLAYREDKISPPRSGYAVCDVEDQASRIREGFRLVVGEFTTEAQQRARIAVAGKLENASAENFPDVSIPYQTFPDAEDPSRWLIQLGWVRWLAPNPPTRTAGHFVKSATDLAKLKAQAGRPYLGIVAEGILAPAGKVRVRDRLNAIVPSNETSHLAAVEGSLRVDDLLTASKDAHIQGRIGIGTISPTGRLTLRGLPKVEPLQGQLTLFSEDADFSYDGGSDKLFIFKDTGGNTAFMGGNVGFGTTNSRNRVGIRGVGTSEELLSFENPTGATKWHINQNLNGNNPGLNFVETDVADGRIFIKAGGNVGVGTTSPVSRLHIGGDIALEATSQGAARVLPSKGTMIWNDGTWLRLNQNLDLSKPIFGVHTPGLFASASMNIGGANGWGDPLAGNVWITGKVGIGTLDLSGSLNLQGALPGHGILALFSQNADFDYDGGNDQLFVFNDRSVGRTAFIGGNIGLGTLNPTVKLDVAGDIHASGLIVASSDLRFKKNIAPLPSLLDRVEKIRGVSYDKIEPHNASSDPAGRREIGVIGQELEAVFPELVLKRGVEQYRAVDYGRLTVVLLEALKELRKEVRAATRSEDLPSLDNSRLLILLEALKELRSEADSLKVRVSELEHKNQESVKQKSARQTPKR